MYPLWPILFLIRRVRRRQIWAYGFTEAVKAPPRRLATAVRSPRGPAVVSAIHLLGADERSPKKEALTHQRSVRR